MPVADKNNLEASYKEILALVLPKGRINWRGGSVDYVGYGPLAMQFLGGFKLHVEMLTTSEGCKVNAWLAEEGECWNNRLITEGSQALLFTRKEMQRNPEAVAKKIRKKIHGMLLAESKLFLNLANQIKV